MWVECTSNRPASYRWRWNKKPGRNSFQRTKAHKRKVEKSLGEEIQTEIVCPRVGWAWKMSSRSYSQGVIAALDAKYGEKNSTWGQRGGKGLNIHITERNFDLRIIHSQHMQEGWVWGQKLGAAIDCAPFHEGFKVCKVVPACTLKIIKNIAISSFGTTVMDL